MESGGQDTHGGEADVGEAEEDGVGLAAEAPDAFVCVNHWGERQMRGFCKDGGVLEGPYEMLVMVLTNSAMYGVTT